MTKSEGELCRVDIIAKSLRAWLSPEFYSEADIHKMASGMDAALSRTQQPDNQQGDDVATMNAQKWLDIMADAKAYRELRFQSNPSDIIYKIYGLPALRVHDRGCTSFDKGITYLKEEDVINAIKEHFGDQ